VLPTYVIPQFSPNAELAETFLLDLVAGYRQATLNSELYTFPAWRGPVPELYRDGGWLERDPFGSEPADKLRALRDAEDWTTNIGHPGPANAAISEVFNSFLLPEMVARVTRGEMTAAESVAQAEVEIRPIFEKWRGRGLIGGASGQ
jgi:multiple sugar transport system substrate-binding protein